MLQSENLLSDFHCRGGKKKKIEHNPNKIFFPQYFDLLIVMCDKSTTAIMTYCKFKHNNVWCCVELILLNISSGFTSHSMTRTFQNLCT